MGLDGVELLLAVEDEFQIHISDDEAGRVSTVGDLHNLVISKLQGKDSKRCLTSAAFYRTRRGIVDALGLARREVRPSTPLEVILPEESRRETWRLMQDSMKLKLPGLQLSGSWVSTLLAAGVLLTVGPGIFARAGLGGLVLLVFLGLVAGGFLIKLSPGLADAFPNGETTVGDLARDTAAINRGRLAAEIGSWAKNDVWDILCRIVVTQTGVERDSITPEASIVDDLGID